MARIRLVRDSGVGDLSLLQLLQKQVFGEQEPQYYTSNNIYNEGDLILYKKDDGTVVILQTKEDDVTGPFDITKWEEKSISDAISNISIDKICIVSLEEPDDKSNVFWLKPIDKIEVTNIPEPSILVLEEFGGEIDYSRMKVLFSEDFPVAEPEDIDPNSDINLYFDQEGEDTVASDKVVEEFKNAMVYNVDEQEDVIVAGEAPDTFDIGDLLLDIDLSNNEN